MCASGARIVGIACKSPCSAARHSMVLMNLACEGGRWPVQHSAWSRNACNEKIRPCMLCTDKMKDGHERETRNT